MAWEISMSPTGWSQVHANLEYMATTPDGRETLARAIADQSYYNMFDGMDRSESEAADFSVEAFDYAMNLPDDVLADMVLSQIVQVNTSDNGGFNVWADADGGVTIPVSPVPGADVVEF